MSNNNFITDYDPYPTLFHYTSLNSFEKILNSGSIKLFDITKSNDPQEGIFILDCLEEAFKDSYDYTSTNYLFAHMLMFKFKEDLLTDGRTSELVLATCFCEPEHKLYLWRCYGDNGKGVSMGFSKEKLIEYASKKSGMEFRAINYYSKNDLVQKCKAKWKEFFEKYPPVDKSTITIVEEHIEWIRDIYYNGYFIKEDIHEDEHEYRLLYKPGVNLADYILIQFKDVTNDDIRFNFTNQGCNFSFDLNLVDNKDLLSDCIVGPACPLGTRELQYVLCKCGLNNNTSVLKESWIKMR